MSIQSNFKEYMDWKIQRDEIQEIIEQLKAQQATFSETTIIELHAIEENIEIDQKINRFMTKLWEAKGHIDTYGKELISMLRPHVKEGQFIPIPLNGELFHLGLDSNQTYNEFRLLVKKIGPTTDLT